MPESTGTSGNFSVAIIGGGLTGLALLVGLLKRKINAQIYEQAPSFTEIGAGVAFGPNAVRAMKALDHQIAEAFERIVVKVGSAQCPDVYFDWITAIAKMLETKVTSFLISFKMAFPSVDEQGGGARRAKFLEDMIRLVPAERTTFDKHLDNVDQQPNGQYTLRFHDGSEATADAVIGCDGIKSRVRQLVLGEDNPQSHPHYSHKYAYRGLVPMDKATRAIGKDAATSRRFYSGMNGHLVCFPVSEGKVMNVVAFKEDLNPWTDSRHVVPSNKQHARKDFEDFGPTVSSIIDMLLEKLDCWAVFDTDDHPASTYYKGRISIAGDAAHASSPHHGAGAGMGIEDAAVMAGLLEEAHHILLGSDSSPHRVLEAAYAAFDGARRERSQFLVSSSRLAGSIYEFRHPPCNDDPVKMRSELECRFKKIWEADVPAFTETARIDMARRLELR